MLPERTTVLRTPHLRLVLESLAETRARIDDLSETDRAHVSAAWLALLDSATSANPWILGFRMVRRHDGKTVGQCGFKGPPTSEGVVEIAYTVEPDMQGNGYATETAEALTMFAFQNDHVRVVRAHTLPETNASTRVLTKSGFRHVGEVTDPEDGLVWRWERCKPGQRRRACP